MEPRLLRRRSLGNRGAAGPAAGPVRRGAPALRGRARDLCSPGHSTRARSVARALWPAAVGAARRAGARACPRRRDDAARTRRLPRHARAGLHDAAGRRAYLRPGGAGRSKPASNSTSPGSPARSSLLAAEGPDSAYVGSIAEALVSGVEGIAVSRTDLERYEPRWERPAEVGWAGHRFLTRAALSGVPETLSRLPLLRELDATARVHALLGALEGPGADGHTTNLVTADSEGNACVLTSSLGLGTGDFLPGLDLQLNSMLGEVDLVLEPLEPGRRMQSMMAPSLAFDRRRGSRWRSARRAGRACARRSSASRPGSSTKGSTRSRRSGVLASTAPATSSTPSRVSTSSARARGDGPARATLAAQHHYFGGVSCGERALQAIRAKRSRRHCVERRGRQPADIPQCGQPDCRSVPPRGDPSTAEAANGSTRSACEAVMP